MVWKEGTSLMVKTGVIQIVMAGLDLSCIPEIPLTIGLFNRELWTVMVVFQNTIKCKVLILTSKLFV